MVAAPSVATDLVVTGIGVTTPWANNAEQVVFDRPRTPLPVDWFDVKTQLGKRGYKYLPAACQYLLAAARAAVADSGEGIEQTASDTRAAAVGTNSGASALHAGMDRTVIATSAEDLSPAMAPFFSINLFSSRLATEHNLKGFNLTFTSPRVAGLEALEFGIRSVRSGRATWILVGTAEAALDSEQPGYNDSEAGAAVLILESRETASARGARIYGECRTETAFLPPSVAESALGSAKAAELIEIGVGALGSDVSSLAKAQVIVDDSPVGTAICEALGASTVRVNAGAGCLEPFMQVVAALASSNQPQAIITATAQGNIAIALVSPEQAANEVSTTEGRGLDVQVA